MLTALPTVNVPGSFTAPRPVAGSGVTVSRCQSCIVASMVSRRAALAFADLLSAAMTAETADKSARADPAGPRPPASAGGAGGQRAATGGGVGERGRLPARVGGVQRDARRDDLA